MTWPVEGAGFWDGSRYDLQILAVDLAGNASVTDGGALTFTRGFLNPKADAFRIVNVPDQGGRVVAGADFTMRLSVLDTTLSRIEETGVRALDLSRAGGAGRDRFRRPGRRGGRP